jgi:serine/threonine protein kinase
MLEAALEEYLTLLEQGNVPTRQDFLARHPEFADELSEFLSNLQFLDTQLGALDDVPRRPAGPRRPQPSDRKTEAHQGTKAEVYLGGFKLIEEIGGGSQGAVYKAEQLGTRRIVALKVMREGVLATQSERRRFELEVELASRLKHPNIVQVYECGEDRGRRFYAMEYVEGNRLDDHVWSAGLGVEATVRLFLQVCDAVHHAHQHGVIHRDLKPSNVLVDGDGQVHILDFGLAKPVITDAGSAPDAVTRVGEFAGTWHYASPEQVKRDPSLVDVRSDVYALGVILYELLTRDLPYAIRDVPREVVARRILETPPARPRTLRPEMDDDLEKVVLYALAKESERRYQSAAALAADLRRFLEGSAVEAKRASSWYVFRKTIRRYRWRVAAGSVLVLSLAIYAVTVAILYERALSANATTQAKSAVVRDSERYTIERLDELHRLSNTLNHVAAVAPDLAPLRRWRMKTMDDPWPQWTPLLETMPDDLAEATRKTDHPHHDAAWVWLRDNEESLKGLAAEAVKSRFVPEVERSLVRDTTFFDHTGPALNILGISQALSARALQAAREDRHGAALESLEAARLLAMDLADGRLLHHKAASTLAREAIYDALLSLLTERAGDPRALEGYLAWVRNDPPLPHWQLALISERQRMAQACEQAVVATPRVPSGFLDISLLDENTGGIYSSEGLLPKLEPLSAAISPSEVISAVDFYLQEVEAWELLPFRQLEAAARTMNGRLREKAAGRLVAPLLPDLRAAFVQHARIRSKRAATMLAALIVEFQQAHSVWPPTLDALPVSGGPLSDPYIGTRFGYRASEGAVILYSINEDEVDNHGTPGRWGQPNTDVVFFQVSGGVNP